MNYITMRHYSSASLATFDNLKVSTALHAVPQPALRSPEIGTVHFGASDDHRLMQMDAIAERISRAGDSRPKRQAAPATPERLHLTHTAMVEFGRASAGAGDDKKWNSYAAISSAASEWADKVIERYRRLDPESKEDVLRHLRESGGIEFTFWVRVLRGFWKRLFRSGLDLHMHHVTVEAPAAHETLDRYIERSARKAAEGAIELVRDEGSEDSIEVDYVALGAEMPLETQLACKRIPPERRRLRKDVSRTPAVIEYNKFWGETGDYGAITAHAERLADRIALRYDLPDNRMKKDVLDLIRETGGIRFKAWLSTLSAS